MSLVVSCAWLAVVAWLIYKAAIQRDAFQALPRAAPPSAETAATVAVIVPARNEAANIRRCLLGLAKQTYPQSCVRIIVVDDHSEDATAAVAESVADDHSQMIVIASPALPRGWIGKPHACWVGAGAAPPEAEWLCFLDADVEAKRELIASAVAFATRQGLGLLSLAPQQELKSFAERLVMPCGFYGLAFCQDLRELQARKSPSVTVTGQFMLIRREAYRAVGGHAAVSNTISEDTALARLIKRAGAAVLLSDGGGLLSTRMYTGWDALWPGLTKNLIDILGGPLPTLGAAACAMTLGWAALMIPGFDFRACMQGDSVSCWALGPALAGSTAALGLHIAGARHFRIPLWYGFLFPLGYTAGAALAVDSVLRRWRGRVVWKGRVCS